MAHGSAEDGHDGIADELLDRSAVALDHLAHRGEVAAHDVPQRLRVHLLVKRRGGLTSENRVVTVRRDSTPPPSPAPGSGAPQKPQSRKRSGFCSPQRSHVTMRGSVAGSDGARKVARVGRGRCRGGV